MTRNKSITLFQKFIKEGMSSTEALCEVMDMFNSQHWHDRDAHHTRISYLEAKEGSRNQE